MKTILGLKVGVLPHVANQRVPPVFEGYAFVCHPLLHMYVSAVLVYLTCAL